MFSEALILIAEDNLYLALDLSIAVEEMDGRVVGPAAGHDDDVVDGAECIDHRIDEHEQGGRHQQRELHAAKEGEARGAFERGGFCRRGALRIRIVTAAQRKSTSATLPLAAESTDRAPLNID